jgi:hypothetical protein
MIIYRNFPFGATTNALGLEPGENGDSGKGVRAPVELSIR